MRAGSSSRFHTLARVGTSARFGAVAAFACALAIAACGENGSGQEGTIPQNAGDNIVAQLDTLKGQVEAGECDAAQETADLIEEAISNLPNDVDGELRETLQTASGNLQTQARDPEQCEEPEAPPPPPPDTGASGAEGVATDEDEG
jgi:hypothetical protein